MEGGTMSSHVAAKSQNSELKAGKSISPLAGKPAPKELLVDVSNLQARYFERQADLGSPNQLVSYKIYARALKISLTWARWSTRRSR